MKRVLKIICLWFSWAMISYHGSCIGSVLDFVQESTALAGGVIFDPKTPEEIGYSEKPTYKQTGQFYLASLMLGFRIIVPLALRLMGMGDFALRICTVVHCGFVMDIAEQYFVNNDPNKGYLGLILKSALKVGVISSLIFFMPSLANFAAQMILCLASYVFTFILEWGNLKTKYSSNFYLLCGFSHLMFRPESKVITEFTATFLGLIFWFIAFVVNIGFEFTLINIYYGLVTLLIPLKLNFTNFKNENLSGDEKKLANILSLDLRHTKDKADGRSNTTTLIQNKEDDVPEGELFNEKVERVLGQVAAENKNFKYLVIGANEINQLSISWSEFIISCLKKFGVIFDIFQTILNSGLQLLLSVLSSSSSMGSASNVELSFAQRETEKKLNEKWKYLTNELMNDAVRIKMRRIIAEMKKHFEQTGELVVFYIKDADIILGNNFDARPRPKTAPGLGAFIPDYFDTVFKNMLGTNPAILGITAALRLNVDELYDLALPKTRVSLLPAIALTRGLAEILSVDQFFGGLIVSTPDKKHLFPFRDVKLPTFNFDELSQSFERNEGMVIDTILGASGRFMKQEI